MFRDEDDNCWNELAGLIARVLSAFWYTADGRLHSTDPGGYLLAPRIKLVVTADRSWT